jgi:hypothetical protein
MPKAEGVWWCYNIFMKINLEKPKRVRKKVPPSQELQQEMVTNTTPRKKRVPSLEKRESKKIDTAKGTTWPIDEKEQYEHENSSRVFSTPEKSPF